MRAREAECVTGADKTGKQQRRPLASCRARGGSMSGAVATPQGCIKCCKLFVDHGVGHERHLVIVSGAHHGVLPLPAKAKANATGGVRCRQSQAAHTRRGPAACLPPPPHSPHTRSLPPGTLYTTTNWLARHPHTAERLAYSWPPALFKLLRSHRGEEEGGRKPPSHQGLQTEHTELGWRAGAFGEGPGHGKAIEIPNHCTRPDAGGGTTHVVICIAPV